MSLTIITIGIVLIMYVVRYNPNRLENRTVCVIKQETPKVETIVLTEVPAEELRSVYYDPMKALEELDEYLQTIL